MSTHANSPAGAPDTLLADIADYVCDATIDSREAYDTARLCLSDSHGCAMLALHYPACTKLLGPVVPGAEMAGGVVVPGTGFELDPVTAAFNIGAMIRWLDYNDTWLAAEWGHPSDNLGAILACADHVSRGHASQPAGTNAVTMRDVLTVMIKAYEIQGIIALDHAFNRRGFDHVLLVRIASTAVATRLLGGGREQVINAVSNAWLDGGALRTYRHAPNTGSRKSWAGGDATSRGVRLAIMATRGEMGYASAMSTPTWGFCDVMFGGEPIELARPLGSYVIENVLFKVSYPAEFHAQTAVETAVQLHPLVRDRLDDIARVQIETQAAAARIIDKTGPLHNPADRDHCIQYMVAVPLIRGTLTADDYEDTAADDGRIDELRKKMKVTVNDRFSRDYLDPDKRAIGNAVQVFFNDGSATERVEVNYPIGHRRRRDEALPLLAAKLKSNLAMRFDAETCDGLQRLFEDHAAFDAMAAHVFADRWRR